MLRLSSRFTAISSITKAHYLRNLSSMTSTVDSLLVPIDPSSISVPQNVPVDVKSLWASARTDNAKPNTTRTFYEKEQIVSVVSLGSQLSKKSTDARNEALRAAVGTGVKGLLEAGAKHIGVASTQNEHVAGMFALQFLWTKHMFTKFSGGSLVGCF